MNATKTSSWYCCNRCSRATKFQNRLCFYCEPPRRAPQSRPSRFERVAVVGAILLAGVAAVVTMKLLWR